MLSKPDRSEAVGTAGQQGDEHVHAGDPVGEVGPGGSREELVLDGSSPGPGAHLWLCKSCSSFWTWLLMLRR